MTLSLEDIPAVSPGGLTLTPFRTPDAPRERRAHPRAAGREYLVLWLNGSGHLTEQYYPAAPAAALDRWREDYPDALAGQQTHDEPEQDDGFTP